MWHNRIEINDSLHYSWLSQCFILFYPSMSELYAPVCAYVILPSACQCIIWAEITFTCIYIFFHISTNMHFVYKCVFVCECQRVCFCKVQGIFSLWFCYSNIIKINYNDTYSVFRNWVSQLLCVPHSGICIAFAPAVSQQMTLFDLLHIINPFFRCNFEFF